MFAAYRPILSLLRGTAFLLAASGLHGLLLPLRGQMEGFSTASLGLMGTAWATGFVAGCYFAPRIVRRAGHVRAFGTFAASGAIIALLTGLIIDEYAWIALRAFTGFVMAGAFMIIESWLNEKATNENRGTVFGLYMMVTYASIMGGQMIVAAGDVQSASLFMITGIFFCLSLIPTAVSTQSTPQLLQDVKLDLKGLYANSPVAAIACLLIGIANGAWGTLGAVYGARIGISTAQIALMMSLVVVAGAVMQLPAGRLSDRTDRRYVLAGAAFGAALFGLIVFLVQPRAGLFVLPATAAYGAFAYTLYSIAVAHANDHARAEDFVKVSGGLLLLYGFGTIIGPLLAAALMEWMR
ncbi:MAG: MFS transporter, partial [Mesorhizobium sp.]|nr:MFS transporter [Mesorhizobium sp.]